MIGDANELAGESFGPFTVVRFHGRIRGRAYWNVRCDCGKSRLIRHGRLLGVKINVCFCDRVLHGNSASAEYRVYRKIKERCLNPRATNFKHYGGRGIKMCEAWRRSFLRFLSDMGRKPSSKHWIERKDNDGDYCPENCVWATIKQQSRNRRTTRMVEINGVSRCLAEWSELSGVPYSVLHERLERGWEPDSAIVRVISRTCVQCQAVFSPRLSASEFCRLCQKIRLRGFAAASMRRHRARVKFGK